MMGLAGRDPVVQAQRELETLAYPSVAAEIDNTCYTCHGVMGKRQLDIDRPGTVFTHKTFVAAIGPDALYGSLARDGISCLACHRMTPDGLGTPASFNSNFRVTGPQTVFGPFKNVVTFPMQNAVGMTPKHGAAISDPAMCGSCHVVETEILNKNIWSSGRSTDKGVLIDDSGMPLVTEFSKTHWQPHWRIITGSKYVQIYESRTKDLQGLLTTSFFGLAKQVKPKIFH